MADSKISDLSAVTSLVGTDELVLARSGTTNKITATDLASSLGTSGYTLITETTVPSGGSANVDFTSIPGTYRHLRIEWVAQSENASAQNLFVRLNNDSGGNYGWGFVDVINGGATSASAQTSGLVGVLSATGDNHPSMGEITLSYYAGTTWKKAVRGVTSSFYSAAQRFPMAQTTWDNTAAVTRVTLVPGASDIKEGSVFSLYGIA